MINSPSHGVISGKPLERGPNPNQSPRFEDDAGLKDGDRFRILVRDYARNWTRIFASSNEIGFLAPIPQGEPDGDNGWVHARGPDKNDKFWGHQWNESADDIWVYESRNPGFALKHEAKGLYLRHSNDWVSLTSDPAPQYTRMIQSELKLVYYEEERERNMLQKGDEPVYFIGFESMGDKQFYINDRHEINCKNSGTFCIWKFIRA